MLVREWGSDKKIPSERKLIKIQFDNGNES